MKVGLSLDDMNEVTGDYDPYDVNVFDDIAVDFIGGNAFDEHAYADFVVYVEDNGGKIHEVDLSKEYDPDW